jgi:hypothetical protein
MNMHMYHPAAQQVTIAVQAWFTSGKLIFVEQH